MKTVKEGGDVIITKDDGSAYEMSNVNTFLLYEILQELKGMRYAINAIESQVGIPK